MQKQAIKPILAASLIFLGSQLAYAQTENKEETDTQETALPLVVENLGKRGVQIVGELETAGGLKAYAGIAQQQPLAIYLTPDEKHIIIGTLIDEEGKDATVGPLEKATLEPWTQQTLSRLEASTWVQDGDVNAPRTIYMLTDANCPFCNRFWEQARPWVEEGAVQIRHILVAILTETSMGKAAAILSSDDPSAALTQHEQNQKKGGITPLETVAEDFKEKIEKNNQLMSELQIEGTPGIFYFDEKGHLQIQRGAPLDEHLKELLGPRKTAVSK